MTHIGYFNGEFGPLEEMKVPMLDRAIFFGDGVYDATITSKGVILYEQDHIDRFFNSASIMRIEPDFTKEELRETLLKLVDMAPEEDNFLYWQVTRGTALRRHQFPNAKPNLMAYISPLPRVDLTKQATIHLVEDTRFLHCNAKTLNLLPNVLAQQAATDAGCDEAVFVRDGFVTEAGHSNIHILKNGELITHPANNLILPGIARKHLIAMCKRLEIPVQERPFTVDELMQADEVIISASSTFAQGVTHADGTPVGQKDRELLALIQQNLTAEFETYIAENAR